MGIKECTPQVCAVGTWVEVTVGESLEGQVGFHHALVGEDFFPHMFSSQMLSGLSPRLTLCQALSGAKNRPCLCRGRSGYGEQART